MTPRSSRDSGTRSNALIDVSIDVAAETLRGKRRRALERRDRRLGLEELAPPQRRELANRYAIARHDKRHTAIQSAHDLSTLVPKLSLGDLAWHLGTVAHVLQRLAF